METIDRLLKTDTADYRAANAQKLYDKAVSRERELEKLLQEARRTTAEAFKRLRQSSKKTSKKLRVGGTVGIKYGDEPIRYGRVTKMNSDGTAVVKFEDFIDRRVKANEVDDWTRN